MEILCFYAGMAFFYTKSVYCLLLLVLGLWFRPSWHKPAYFTAAFLYGALHQLWVQDKAMPLERVVAQAKIEGVIVSIPSINPGKTQFQFHVLRLNEKAVDATILLACYSACPQFKAGQHWFFRAKLKRPTNLANPGHFDFAGSLRAKHLNWTGSINPKTAQLNEASQREEKLLSLRERLAASLEPDLLNSKALGILEALTLNVTSKIDKAQWDLFRRTGTTHLMVISGSHIALIAGFIYWLTKWLYSRFGRLPLYYPAAKLASLFSFLAALGYALLAGFEAPSQRALFACFFMLLRNFLSQKFTVWQAWRYGLFLVLIYEPHAVLQPGFYLSFIAVAILILTGIRVVGGSLKKALLIQLACLVGLMPLSLYWFSYGALNGYLANLVAIPLVGFVVVPLGLIHLLLIQMVGFSALALPIKIAMEWLLAYLAWVDSFAFINFNYSYNDLVTPLALMLAMLISFFLPLRTLFIPVVVLVIAALFPSYPNVEFGNYRVDVLDVGQGLAIVVQTAKHLLIYDTGAKFYRGGDMAKFALIPYLNWLGVSRIDKVVISHPDLDHRGGLPSLEERYPAFELLVDKPAVYRQAKNCHAYQPWVWEGVSFQFMAIASKFRSKNNRSCVLKISNQAGRVLLTGDIEKEAEAYLVSAYGKELEAEVLIVPHHGSKTSSSWAFLKEVSPRYALISSGFDNRFHFPHQEILTRLARQEIATLNTASCGMISVEFNSQKGPPSPQCYTHGS